MTALGGIDMVMYMTMLMYLVLAESICFRIDHAAAAANIPITCCCEYVRNTAAANITYMK